ncbi:NUDIX hydrolase [Rivibacter subsaxonicus]|uniref:Phosphatase NudJ n=1 Tax=Rivibacter subsaxonicus TaxID=457575 RepID=A0A4Q7VWZ8_9BURK|nr:NUDIX hydrolase [Rivibacter subsaxonicus]RZU01173.1 ADP-ribose pyrophosphatase YjhB (NUDIX family) [Rivibacter subsaxonicus]
MQNTADPGDRRWRPSVTVAAVIERDGRYLLVEEHTSEGIRLNNPAGHLEPGESLIEAVQREVLEETGCRFTPTAMLPVCMSRFRRPATGEDITYLRFAFVGSVGEPEPGRKLDDGIVRTLWLTPAEIDAERARHRSPLLWKCICSDREGRTLPLDSVWVDPSIYQPEIKS